MFASLPPGGRLVQHRDPYAGSLRYHMGLLVRSVKIVPPEDAAARPASRCRLAISVVSGSRGLTAAVRFI